MADATTRGGVSTLDRSDVKVDPELAEQNEPQRIRTDDQLSVAMASVLGKHPGGHISNYQLIVQHANSRDTEIVYDRFYWEQNLLVDFFQTALNKADGAENDKRRAEHETFAKMKGKKYFAITGGATMADVQRALNA